MPPRHFLFVDFENVREIDLDLIQDKLLKVLIVLGKRHSSLPQDLVNKLLKFPAQVECIKTACSGKNALDFVLSCEIGVYSVNYPGAIFHLLSRDKGFEALIQHLLSKNISITRYEAFDQIPILGLKPPGKKLIPESTLSVQTLDRIRDMSERFSKNLNRPQRKSTLYSHIHIRYGKKLTESEIQEIVEGLISHQILEITSDGKVRYL